MSSKINKGVITIKKNLGYFLLAAVILSGCSDSNSEVEAQQVEEVSPEQQGLIKEYEKYIEEDLTMVLFKDFYRRFVEEEGNIKINDDLEKVFNEAVKKEIDDGVEKYHETKNWINEDFVSIENKKYLAEQELEYTEDTEKILVDFIDNFDGGNSDSSAVDSISTYGYLKNNEDIKALSMFAEALKFSDSETTVNSLLRVVSPYYSGGKGAEMKKFIESKGISLSEWVQTYNSANGTNLTDRGEGVIDYNPAIGMTAEEVEASTWGKPQSVNRTVTATTTKEQWIYPNYKYLYFENGVMTSFQD